nr:hypothetical protein CFP56_26860 [Quercus suber]
MRLQMLWLLSLKRLHRVLHSWKARVRRQRRLTRVGRGPTRRRASDTADRASVPRRAASGQVAKPTRADTAQIGPTRAISAVSALQSPCRSPKTPSLTPIAHFVQKLQTPSLTPISIARLSLLSVLSGCLARPDSSRFEPKLADSGENGIRYGRYGHQNMPIPAETAVETGRNG